MLQQSGIPEFVGPYRTGSVIMETDTSVIYESYHPQRCLKLAIKCIKKGTTSIEAIERECTIMREIDSREIINVVDIFDLDGYRCIVMPLATGGDLYEYIKEVGYVDEHQAKNIIHGALIALEYLHHDGIWHRDVKPENFLLLDNSMVEPEVVLADFGHAGRFAAGETSTEFLGSPLYAAPEIYRREPYTEKVDIWALGVTMYVLLSGESPFPMWDQTELSTAILYGNYDFDSEIWEDISEEAKELIQLMLCVDPTARISAQDALRHSWLASQTLDRKPQLAQDIVDVIDMGMYDESDDSFAGF